jgi:hypothetical protein
MSHVTPARPRPAGQISGSLRPGRPDGDGGSRRRTKVNKRSPFFIGMLAAAGVVVTYGALIAIPVAAALRLLLHEVAFRRLDRS